MQPDQDNSVAIQQQVRAAIDAVTPLNICAGNSKNFYGNPAQGETLDVSLHKGIVSYEPTELVITARCGSRLEELDAILREKNQMLAFEPAALTAASTLGGTIACNLSGPRRPFSGAARDFILGCKIINGHAELLGFGGQVMKNVAGYDVSRLMAGALGTLGIVMEVSLKVLPRPEVELTLMFSSTVATAIRNAHAWQRLPLPISAISFDNENTYLRLSGTENAVKQAQQKLGGEELNDATEFWRKHNQLNNDYFSTPGNLWRLSVPSAAEIMRLSGSWFYDWAGAQRWLISTESADVIRATAQAAGGHAVLYRSTSNSERFQKLPEAMMQVHKQLKLAFDPHGIFNRGRLYRDL